MGRISLPYLIYFSALAAMPILVHGQSTPAPAVVQGGQSGTMPPAPPEDSATSPANVIRLSDVEGSVRLFDTNGAAFSETRQNMTVLPGMRVETGNDGRAELEFPDGSVARVTPNSALSLAAGDAKAGQLLLKPTLGLTYFEFATAKEFAVQVGPVVARTSASAVELDVVTLLRVNLDAAPWEAAVLHGEVRFEDAGGNVSYDLPTNQTARIDPAAVNNYDIVQELTNDTWDEWNGDRDSTLADLAAGAGGGHNAEDAGWSDLDYYGRWYNVPGQGLAWAPDGVGEDFDPYGSGAWSYYTSTGYSWTSSYPWGWLPYHCGAWNYYGGAGWMWAPGSCGWGVGGGFGGGRWYPYPRIHGGPAGYHPPQRPIRRIPRPATVVAVNRVPEPNFRQPGGPRPVARTLQVAGQAVEPLPMVARPSYGSVNGPGTGAYRGGRAVSQPSAVGQPGYGAGLRPGAQPSGRLPAGQGYLAPRGEAPRASAPASAAPRAAAPESHAAAPSAPAGSSTRPR